jgi:type II restriction/modification system DNA methylase subunit YeeA
VNPATFISKWSRTTLPERAASQEHFLDLCRLVGVQTPAELDPVGDTFTFEKGVHTTGPASAGSKGDRGFADVWYKGRFGWEYKRKDKYKDLKEALRQLQQYREALENPPLLIVSDIARTEIHTNFTGFKPETHIVELQRLTEPAQLDLLRRAFTDPDSFKPVETAEQVTEKAAKAIGEIAQNLRARGHDPHDAAHFLMKVMFCLFAEDVELLPKGLFETVLQKSKFDPARLKKQMDALFAAMREGGDFGTDDIPYFNGGLFDDAQAIELTEKEIASLVTAATRDWSAVEPSVFGTLFERSLDPGKRAQIGAHYTSRDDIMLVIEPVIVRPLRREWEETKATINDQLQRRRTAKTPATKKKADAAIADALDAFQSRLASVRVLDPACGSGNFLYVAIQQLLALEKEVIVYASRPEIGTGLLPRVRPTQLLGIEINPYAAELAQVVIWIGYLQWMRDNGFNAPRNPILEPIETIENRDAILAWEDEQGQPIPAWREGAVCRGQAEWPGADFIVGNPPFLGSKVFRQNGLPDGYVAAMYDRFNIPNTSDLCCYWFALAHKALAPASELRVGLLATQGIRGSDNRTVLQRIKTIGTIYDAWGDRPWILDGAAVHVSIIAFSGAKIAEVHLDGVPVTSISADLRGDIDLTDRSSLSENAAVGWSIGTQKGGAFEFPWEVARQLLLEPNPNGRLTLEVLRPWRNGSDLTRRQRGIWIVDFGPSRSDAEAAGYERAFEYVREHVKPERDTNRRDSYRLKWWIHQEPRNELRPVLDTDRVLLTPRVAKHRLWSRSSSEILPDCALCVFARSDDYFFGVLHSTTHELWARRQGTQLREAESGFRYTPTTCFETFPLPWPPGSEPTETDPLRPIHDTVADAAKALNEQRERWLNPPEWIDEIAQKIDAEDDFADVARVSGEEARRLIRQSAIDAAAAKHPKLKKRTLTNLYNERPTWLRLAHKALDEAVLAAYAATDPAAPSPWDPAWAEVFVETGAGQPLPPNPTGEPHALAERRAEVEQAILANLLRLNQERANNA